MSDHPSREDDNHRPPPRTPWLEWTASGIGLILALATFGAIAWQGWTAGQDLPEVTVAVDTVTPVEGGFRVVVRARNVSGAAAAQVVIEGALTGGEGDPEVSRILFDYVPGHSDREGGLFFTRDPRSNRFKVRAAGYVRP